MERINLEKKMYLCLVISLASLKIKNINLNTFCLNVAKKKAFN